jgi:hypothetical protein
MPCHWVCRHALNHEPMVQGTKRDLKLKTASNSDTPTAAGYPLTAHNPAQTTSVDSWHTQQCVCRLLLKTVGMHMRCTLGPHTSKLGSNTGLAVKQANLRQTTVLHSLLSRTQPAGHTAPQQPAPATARHILVQARHARHTSSCRC